MKALFIGFVLIGAIIAAFSVAKMADGIQNSAAEQPAASAMLVSGQMTPVYFVADQTAKYETPCEVVCKDGRKGTLLFSSMR